MWYTWSEQDIPAISNTRDNEGQTLALDSDDISFMKLQMEISHAVLIQFSFDCSKK